MNKTDPRLLIELLLLGDLNEDDSRRVAAWLAESPEGQSELEAARLSLEAIRRQLAPPEESPEVAERIVSICRRRLAPHAVDPASGASRTNQRSSSDHSRRAMSLVGIGLLAALLLWIAVARPWRTQAPEPDSAEAPRASDPRSTDGATSGALPGGQIASDGRDFFPATPNQDDPTLIAYQQAALESEEAFFALLDKQALTMFPPSTPVFNETRNER